MFSAFALRLLKVCCLSVVSCFCSTQVLTLDMEHETVVATPRTDVQSDGGYYGAWAGSSGDANYGNNRDDDVSEPDSKKQKTMLELEDMPRSNHISTQEDTGVYTWNPSMMDQRKKHMMRKVWDQSDVSYVVVNLGSLI